MLIIAPCRAVSRSSLPSGSPSVGPRVAQTPPASAAPALPRPRRPRRPRQSPPLRLTRRPPPGAPPRRPRLRPGAPRRRPSRVPHRQRCQAADQRLQGADLTQASRSGPTADHDAARRDLAAAGQTACGCSAASPSCRASSSRTRGTGWWSKSRTCDLCDGEVNTPGAVPLKGSMSVLQALALPAASRTRQQGRHKNSAQGPGTDRVETIPFSYKNAIRSDAEVFYLAEGDTVVVP